MARRFTLLDDVYYDALAPRRIAAVYPDGAPLVPGVERDESAVADVLRARPDVFREVVELGDGTRAPVVSREVALTGLLAAGGLAIGLAGLFIRLLGPIDPDDVRDILKAARMADHFQPLLELMALG